VPGDPDRGECDLRQDMVGYRIKVVVTVTCSTLGAPFQEGFAPAQEQYEDVRGSQTKQTRAVSISSDMAILLR